MLRTECAGCGHTGLTVFADLGSTPLADVFESDARSAVDLPRYPLRAATCEACGLAQLLDVVDDKLLYGDDYGFRTGGSPSSLPYMAELARYAIECSPRKGLVVEIGCNDGTLMGELIHGYGGRDLVIGIDPSGVAAQVDGPVGRTIVNRPFTAELAAEYCGCAGLVVAVNVAAHVADPHDFLEGIFLMLAPDGVAVVEFQNFPDLLAGCMFDLIYHEHRFFYSFGSFRDLAAQHGLFVTGMQKTPAQGGSVRVVLNKARPGFGLYRRPDMAGLLAGFQARAEYARDRIRDVVQQYDGAVCGYAASAKSCTLLNWCELGPDDLVYIADATRSKWQRFTPGTGIQINAGVGAAYGPDAYLLLASNYLSGVLRREQAAGFKGQFIVPLPLPVIV